MIFLFILNGHEVVPTDDPAAWAEWFTVHNAERVVGNSTVGSYTVSTIFLGCAHPPFTITGPSLFETALFTPDASVKIVTRYRTWEDAAEGHALVVAEITKTVIP